MHKLVLIIGGFVLLAGVATAGTFAGLGSNSSQPRISTSPPPATTRQADVRREDRQADRRQDRANEVRGRANEPGEDARGRANEPGEDVRGREAEPNDDRGVDNAADDSNGGPSANSGPSDDSGSGHGGGDD